MSEGKRTLPPGWVAATLSEVADVRLGRQRSPDKHSGENPRPYLRAANVTWSGLDLSDVNSMDFSDDEAEVYELRDGDVLLNEASGSPDEVGKAALYRGEIPGCCFQNTLIRVRPGEDLDPQFVQQKLLLDARSGRFVSHGRGIGITHIGSAKMRTWPIPVPPLAEQRRIVAKLDDLLARSRRAKETLAEVPALLERYRRSVLAAAFCGELTADWRKDHPDVESATELLRRSHHLPDGFERPRKVAMNGVVTLPVDAFPSLPLTWEYRSIDELYESNIIVDYADGNHGSLYPRKEEFGDVGEIFVTATQIERGLVDLKAAPRLSKSMASRLTKGWARGGDVLLTHNATVGRVARVPQSAGRFLLGTSVTFYRVLPEALSPDYLYHAMCAPGWQAQLSSIMAQTTRNQVSIQKQAFLRIAVAPLAEQVEIARRIDAAFAKVGVVEEVLAEQMNRLASVEMVALTRAFRGELVPQDPTDEPASVLLDRIRKERAAMPPQGTRSPRKTTAAAHATPAVPDVAISASHWPAHVAAQGTAGLRVDSLYKASKLSADEFYRELRAHLTAARLREDRRGHDVWIVAP